MSNNRTTTPALAAVMVLAVMSLTDFVGAYGDLAKQLSGRKFTIVNVFAFDGTPACPSANPNTVAFYPSSSNPLAGTVTVAGEFDAASFGVCTVPPGAQGIAVAPGTTIQYYIYGDWVLFQIPGRVRTGSKFAIQQPGKLSAVGVGNPFYVSVLTDVGPAK